MSAKETGTFNLAKYLPLILLIGGVLGFLASFILTIETIKSLQNPGYTPSCSLNPILSCASVMKADQSSVFGFANSLIGIGGFAGLVTVGIALTAGANFKRWLWMVIQGVSTLGLIFTHWLIFESLYRIGSLCPFCMVVWSVTIPIFWYLTLYNLKLSTYSRNPIFLFAYRHHADVLILWFLIIIGLILNRFWYYWVTLI
jgi:uncharacterized membrane protein